jgi:ligand-binding sensor domain-containing protein
MILMPCIGLSQTPHFQRYTFLKKNEPIGINAIYQDHTGFIWYGTNKGLFKFDGSKFFRYTTADSLPDDNVTAIQSDSLGRIWTGHRSGQLAYFENGRATKFAPAEGNATQAVSDILFDKKGRLWFSTLNDGLYCFSEGRLFRFDESEGMPDIFVYNITDDGNGNIWAGTDGGVVVCSLNEKKPSVKVYNYKNGLPDNIIKKLAVDSTGVLWIATEAAGLGTFDPTSGTYKPILDHGWNFGAITDFVITANQIWISTLQTGLLVFDRKTNHLKIYNTKAGAEFSSIQTMLNDKEGNVWLGSRIGVLRSRGDVIEFIDAFDPVSDVNAVAVVADQKGDLWFANSQGLFKRHLDASGKAIVSDVLGKSEFRKFTVISLYADPFGYVWAGLYGEGAIRINPDNGSMQHLNKELRNGNILNITGKGDDVWLATLGGVSQIKVSGDKFSVKNFTSQDGLISDYIYQVFVDSKSRLWFSTDGKGVDMLDESGVHHFQEGFNSKVVYGMTEDGAHNLWANVQGEGLYKFDGKKFQPFDPQNKILRDNNIGCFTATPEGNLFIMHDLGIDIYDVTTNRVHYLGEEIGIRAMKPYLNAVARDSNGGLFVGTDRGIVRYADVLESRHIAPHPLIGDFDVLNKPFRLVSGQSLSHTQNDITIHYLGLWFQNPTALNYQYKLENYDREWISSRDQAVTYSSLPPGDYTFNVRASDTEDFIGVEAATIGFRISPPFWKTGWFYGLAFSGIVVALYFIIKFRERRLWMAKQILEARVQERTLEIKKKNEEIHAQAEEIRMINENLEQLVHERTQQLERKNQTLEKYAFINAHELRAPVASILGLISLMQNLKLEEDEKIYLKHLETSAEKLDKVVRSIGHTISKGEGN